MMAAQQSLNNFLQSINFHNPDLADALLPDCTTVSLYAMSSDKMPGKAAAERLRRAAFDLPVIQARVLEMALDGLGY